MPGAPVGVQRIQPVLSETCLRGLGLHPLLELKPDEEQLMLPQRRSPRAKSMPPERVLNGTQNNPNDLLSPMSRRGPLMRRGTKRGRAHHQTFAFMSNPAGEIFAFPARSDCAHCYRELHADVMRGKGLCETCYAKAPKDCMICHRTLDKRELEFDSGICNTCYDNCDKSCRLCNQSLAHSQLHWNTGLCDGCYNKCEKECMMCHTKLDCKMLRWGTGLCDSCYNEVKKECRICNSRIEEKQLRWNSGLCDKCYDMSEKTCSQCHSKIALGSLHWRSKMCDTCWDARKYTCKTCTKAISEDERRWATGLCDDCYVKLKDKDCAKCKQRIDSKQLHWGTGLCDECYTQLDKVCKTCGAHMPFGQRQWGSGLCDSCYDKCERNCTMCKTRIDLGALHWGTCLCDSCYNKVSKNCLTCRKPIALGDLKFVTGRCNSCYDKQKVRRWTGLSVGVRTVIAAQLVFYIAPGALQPSLYLRVHQLGYGPSPAAVYAAVLTVASVVSMIAPVPLGLWADKRGEREVYWGMCLAAALGGILFFVDTPVALFAAAWALVNLPPAVRGVRAAYFAKYVAPEELSRAGQLASSAGLMGGFLGPLVSVIADSHFGATGPSNGFTACAVFAAVGYLLCGLGLRVLVPATKGRRSAQGGGGGSADADDVCELCSTHLRDEEKHYSNYLCDHCYDNFGGEMGNFKRYSRRVLAGFCLMSMLLEISMNAGVVATFQPIAVSTFGWGNNAIAAVNLFAAGLSVVISLTLAQLRIPERSQMAAAAGLYLAGVTIYCAPPLAEWRLVLGLMLGLKAQIVFMAPFTAIFSRLIGKARVTNQLTTFLCLAPAIGTALGTALAPFFVVSAGTWGFLLATAPALTAVAIIAVGWRQLGRVPKQGGMREEGSDRAYAGTASNQTPLLADTDAEKGVASLHEHPRAS